MFQTSILLNKSQYHNNFVTVVANLRKKMKKEPMSWQKLVWSNVFELEPIYQVNVHQSRPTRPLSQLTSYSVEENALSPNTD